MSPKLLLHICCGPCATEVVRRLKDEYEVVGFFYNPNIYPIDEYQRRLAEVQRLATSRDVSIEVGGYDHPRFLELVRGLEDEPEGGGRCRVCFRMRLEQTARKAVETGCLVAASTLTIGPNKRADVINPIGRDVCAAHGVGFMEADWKKKDGFRRSVKMSRELDLYRQDYCGCEFSMRSRRIRTE